MAEAGFLEQKARPGSALVVVLMHGAGIAALMFAGTEIIKRDEPPIVVRTLPTDPPPPPQPVDPPPRPQPNEQTHQSRLDTPTRSPIPTAGPVVTGPEVPPQPPTGTVSEQPPQTDPYVPPQPPADPPPLPPPPVRTAAQLDTSASALQPPYPASEERMQREGDVTVQVTIGANGRVTAVQKVAATSEAFYNATARHARERWRFRPATVDGRPVESSKTMTVRFRLDD